MSPLSSGNSNHKGSRIIAVFLVLFLLSPIVASGVLKSSQPTPIAEEPAVNESESLVVISAQGDEVSGGDDSRIVILNTVTEKIVWQSAKYSQYYDVDPLNESTILYTAQLASGRTYAVVHNWQTNEIYNRLEVTKGAHDIDSIGNGSFIYTDGRSHRVVKVDGVTGEESVLYDIRNHFPTSAGGGDPSTYEGHYSHLNDVDLEKNGAALLISPRNFDRVVLINLQTKKSIWTLGEEDNYNILYEQHNPTLLDHSPPTVLVADSENDRVIEYRKSGDEWNVVWSYNKELQWPRDADRLPNGNTLIIDSRYAMEVTPSRDVVWKVRIPKFLYDIEYIRHGDEPAGPSMAEHKDKFESPRQPTDDPSRLSVLTEASDHIHNASRWFLPWWISPFELWSGIAAVFILFVWVNFEARWYGVSRPSIDGDKVKIFRQFGPTLLGIFAVATLFQSVEPSIVIVDGFRIKWWLWDPAYHTVGLVGLLEAALLAKSWESVSISERNEKMLASFQFVLATALCSMGVGLLVIGLDLPQLSIQLSSPLKVLSMGVVAELFGGRRLIHLLPLNQRLIHRSIRGALLGLAGIGVLSVGTTDVGTTGVFLGLGLSLGLLGHHNLSRVATDAFDDKPIRVNVLLILLYVFRAVLLILGLAVFLRLLGLGTIVGIGLRWDLLQPANITAVTLLIITYIHQKLNCALPV